MVQCTYAINIARADFVHLIRNPGAPRRGIIVDAASLDAVVRCIYGGAVVRCIYPKEPITGALDRGQRARLQSKIASSVNNARQRKCDERKLEETHDNDSCGGCAQMEDQ